MSVDVKVENFDVNGGLQASVNIDGEIFTINIDPDSIQKVLAENTVELTQANLEKNSNNVQSPSIKSNYSNLSGTSVSSIYQPFYKLKKKQLTIDLTSKISEDDFKEKYPGIEKNAAPKSDLSVDKTGAAGQGVVYGYENAANNLINIIEDDESLEFTPSSSIKTTISDDNKSSLQTKQQINKANTDFDKEFNIYVNNASKEYLELSKDNKIYIIEYFQEVYKNLKEMNEKVKNDNSPYALQFKENIRREIEYIRGELNSLEFFDTFNDTPGESNKSDDSSIN